MVRHLALAKGVVQGGANVVDRHAQGVGAVAVDLELRLQAVELGVAGHVAKERVGAQLAPAACRPRR